jgi:hypothetical protein
MYAGSFLKRINFDLNFACRKMRTKIDLHWQTCLLRISEAKTAEVTIELVVPSFLTLRTRYTEELNSANHQVHFR